MKAFLLIPAATFLVLSAFGQGTFQNLDFEAATISQNQATGSVSVADALPGWGVFFYYGPAGQTSIPQSQISFNFINPWVPQVVLLGTNGVGQSSLNGAFSVLLQAMNLPGYQLQRIAIDQTGIVPAMARSILFEAQPGTETFFVSLNGQTIPIIPLAQDSRYTLFGGDIEAFAGQSSELQFSVYAPLSAPGGWNIDSIKFSDQPIPEPQTGLLLVSGMGLLFLLRRRLLSPGGGNRA